MSEEMQLALEHTLKTMRELKEAKAEIERLRAALEPFTCTCEDQCMADAEWASPPAKPSADICAHFAARAALGGEA